MGIKIIIECRECDRNLLTGQDVICVECYDAMLDERIEIEDELRKKIDKLEEELAEIKYREG